jgi:hypothetical protein
MARKYTYGPRVSEANEPVTLSALMSVAGRRLKSGQGMFTITREEWYRHPKCTQDVALRMIREMAESGPLRSQVRIDDKSGVTILHFRPHQAFVYDNPLRDCVGVRGLRQDQGVDYAVSKRSPVYAIGPGVVTIYRPTSGWPLDINHSDGGAYIAYKLTEGPAAGLYVYDAEHIEMNTNLGVGSHLEADTVIANHQPGYANCEMGWASSETNGYSPQASGCYQEGNRTAAGDNFDKFMQALGAPAGLKEGRSIRCPLPSKYPRTWDDRV